MVCFGQELRVNLTVCIPLGCSCSYSWGQGYSGAEFADVLAPGQLEVKGALEVGHENDS